jgi:hypothetical protein
MAVRYLKSFLPSADELLNLDLRRLGEILLMHLKTYEGQRTVHQMSGFNRQYFVAMMERKNVGLGPMPGNEPEYGDRQPEATRRTLEAWNWLEREGLLMRNPDQPHGDWFLITTEGAKLLERLARYEKWDKLGVDRVRADLTATGGIREVGGGPGVADMAWEWVRMKENKPPLRPTVAGAWTLISDTRLDELRGLVSTEFDFKKLIRLCEELNTAYREECYFATAMLTRSLLDHVPPLFGKKNFDEVASNYGGRSFKGTLQHLQNTSRNVADGHLHQQIRKSEALPTAQQVNCGQELDALLEEIVRITLEKGGKP